jgi:hypothetical protein
MLRIQRHKGGKLKPLQRHSMFQVDTECRIRFWRLHSSKKQPGNFQMAMTNPERCSAFLANKACSQELKRFLGKRIPKYSLRWHSKVLETNNTYLQDTADKHAGRLEG